MATFPPPQGGATTLSVATSSTNVQPAATKGGSLYWDTTANALKCWNPSTSTWQTVTLT